MKQIPKIVILGPQGSGKGTQAIRLGRLLQVPHISTGEELRQEMAQGSALGKKITAIMNAGILISDHDTNAVMRKCLSRPTMRHGWVVDGYPRRMGQARPMMSFAPPNILFLLEISDSAAIKRLSGRRVCPHGHVYHLDHQLPKKRPGFCDYDGLPLKRRDDDLPAAIRRRLGIYHHETEPMIDWLEKHVPIIRLDGRPSIDVVFRKVKKELSKLSWLS